jgi:catechol 2,3-dioxygenase-like lactoylglutathione lyase family enzyme
MISSIHSVVIDVPDLEAAQSDYSRLLGQEPGRVESNSEAGMRSAWFVLANTSLELRAFQENRGSAGDEIGAGLSMIRLTSEDETPSRVLASRDIGLDGVRDEEAVSEGELEIHAWRSHRIDLCSSRGLRIELVSGETGGPDSWSTEGVADIAPESRIRALDHVVLMSPDPEATRAFYGDGLGIRLALDKTFEGRGVRLIFFRTGAATTEIGGRLGAEARPDRPDRFGGLAWQVVDLDAIHSRLAADRFDVSEIRDGHKPGTRVCTVRDPVHAVPTLLIEPAG